MVSVPWMTTTPRQPLSSAPLIAAASSNRSPKERDAPGLRRKSTVRSSVPMQSKPGTAASSSAAESAGDTPPPGARVMAIVPPSPKTPTHELADSVTGEPFNRSLATNHRSPPDIGASAEDGGLPVAGAWPQLHAVRAGRGEYGGFDECRDGRAASEPCGQRWHGEPNVLGDQLHEGIDVGHAPRADVPLQELPHPRIADRRLRGSSGPHSLPGTR